MSYKRAEKVLFVYDGPVFEDENGKIYADENIWRRYLFLGSTIVNLIRVIPRQSEKCKGEPLNNELYSVVRVPNLKSLRGLIFNRIKVRKIVEEAVVDADIVMARLPSRTGSLAVYYSHKHGKPLLTEMVGCTKDVYWYHSFKGKLIAHYFYRKQLKVMKMVKYCVYVTEIFLQNRYTIQGEKIGCSDVKIKKLDPSVLIKKTQNIKKRNIDEPYVLASIGQLSLPLKGHIDVICAIQKLKKLGVIFHYHLVGAGDTSKIMSVIKKLKLENEVTIRGPLAHEDIFDFLDSIDIYIQPSRTEGLPRAMVEAMSRACAVVGSSVGGIPELTHKENLFEPGNIKQIVEILLSFDKEKLLAEMNRSYDKASFYEGEVLDKKREEFYKLFLNDHHLATRK